MFSLVVCDTAKAYAGKNLGLPLWHLYVGKEKTKRLNMATYKIKMHSSFEQNPFVVKMALLKLSFLRGRQHREAFTHFLCLIYWTRKYHNDLGTLSYETYLLT